jgi:hypothetical protein
MVAAMDRQAPVLLRKEKVERGRMTVWRLICSDCGELNPPMRSKTMLSQVATEHAGKEHRFDRVSLLP